MLIVNRNGTFRYKNNYTIGDGLSSVTTSDFNNDTLLDLAATNYVDDRVTVLLGRGNGTFGDGSTVGVGIDPKSLVISDFNNDTTLDLAIIDIYSGATTVALNNCSQAY